jgi:hypothetical protein
MSILDWSAAVDSILDMLPVQYVENMKVKDGRLQTQE